MNGIVLYFNYGYLPSNLDLAVLKDLGYNVTTPTPIAKLDFSGDGHSDILFHDSGGNTAFFDVRAGGASVAVSLGNVDPSWQIQDTGKYGDGSNEDILWRNSSTGQLISWSLTGDQKAAGYTDLGTVSSVWAIQTHNSSSDFFQDGADDILWRNSSTEQLVVWNMKAGKASNVVDLGTGPSADWKLVATADFTGDGSADILWRNSVSGQNFLWKWDGGSTGSTDVGTVATEWSIAGTGDFTGDGASDLLWYDNLTHQAVYWNLKDGGGHSGYTDLGTIPTGWQLQNPRDVTGDGTADLLVQNTSNGTIGYWPMDPGVSHALHTIATVSPGWHIT
nr:VCBS repeat-containing protein [Bradyrhizobium sp. 146]